MNLTNHQKYDLRLRITAVLGGWPKLMAILESGDIDGHPDQLIAEIVNTVDGFLSDKKMEKTNNGTNRNFT